MGKPPILADWDEVVGLADGVLARSEALLSDASQSAGQKTHRRWSEQENPQAVSVQPASSNRKLAPQREVQVGDRVRNEPLAPYCSSTYVSIQSTCPDSCAFKGAGCYAAAGMAVQRLDRGAKALGLTGTQLAELEAEAIDQLFVRGVPQDGARGGRDLRLHVSGDAASATAMSHWRCSRPVELAGTRVIPCPNQTRGRTCIQCRLCFDADRLFDRRAGISFQIHGKDRDAAIVALDAVGSR